MQDAFETIKQARAVLEAMPPSTASDKTKAGYARQLKRLLSAGKTTSGLLIAARNTQKINTWFSRKAAIKHGARENVARLLSRQDAIQRRLRNIPKDDPRWTEWYVEVKSLAAWLRLLNAVTEAAAIPEKDRKNRKGKRVDMRGLPDDWRSRIIARMPNYRAAVIVAAVTGCRPDELVHGVQIEVIGDEVVATIKGSKTTEKTGQPWRRLAWPLLSESHLVRLLVELALEKPVNEARVVSIKNARAFSGAMRAAAQREWPLRKTTITPYCLRHQAAADMKDDGGLSSGDISAALGHCSDVTKTAYGHRGMATSGGVSPARVESARPVAVKPPSKAAARRASNAGQGKTKRAPSIKIGPAKI